jgi:hypothetical protein
MDDGEWPLSAIDRSTPGKTSLMSLRLLKYFKIILCDIFRTAVSR